MEAYLNDLAWDYVQTHDSTTYSNKTRKFLTEEQRFITFKDKLSKYSQKITGENLWQEPDRDFDDFIDLKIARDSLVHPCLFLSVLSLGGMINCVSFIALTMTLL